MAGGGRGVAGVGLAVRLLGVSVLRFRRRGPIAAAEGLGPAVPSPPSGLEGRGWRPGQV